MKHMREFIIRGLYEKGALIQYPNDKSAKIIDVNDLTLGKLRLMVCTLYFAWDKLLIPHPLQNMFIKFEAFEYAPFTMQTSNDSRCHKGMYLMADCLAGFEPEILRSIAKRKAFTFGVIYCWEAQWNVFFMQATFSYEDNFKNLDKEFLNGEINMISSVIIVDERPLRVGIEAAHSCMN